MGRNFTHPTIKTLFGEASSCAFPGCEDPLVFRDRGAVTAVADIAHIRSESPAGPRHDPEFTGDLNGHENLLLLCGRHHRAVDRHEALYPVDELLAWKQAQVEQAGSGTRISDADVRAYTRLSEEERSTLTQLARVAQRLVDRVTRADDDAARVLQGFNDAHQRAFQQMGPLFTVDGDGTQHRMQSDSFRLPRVEQERWQARLNEAIEAQAAPIQEALGQVGEESAVLRMVSSGLLPWINDLSAAVDALVESIGSGTISEARAAVDAAVAGLWRAATGQTVD